MKKSVACVLSFVGGIAVGSVSTMLLIRRSFRKAGVCISYDDWAEPVSEKEEDMQKYNTTSSADPDTMQAVKKEKTERQSIDYTQYAKSGGASSVQSPSQQLIDAVKAGAEEATHVPVPEDKPYEITPQEFNEIEGYEVISLRYYVQDNTLADDNDELVDDIDSIVGEENLQKFGHYEDDCVYVRNDRMKCDYEILLDYGSYEENVRERRQWLYRELCHD